MGTLTDDKNNPRSFAVTRTWTLGADDAGEWIEGAAFGDKTLHCYGAPDGATLLIEGSNDKSNAVTMQDVFGNNCSYTSMPKMPTLMGRPRWIRARTSGGTGNTALTIILEAARSIK